MGERETERGFLFYSLMKERMEWLLSKDLMTAWDTGIIYNNKIGLWGSLPETLGNNYYLAGYLGHPENRDKMTLFSY